MDDLKSKSFLVIGATGHVGSKVAVLLANKGFDVTALVRKDGMAIRDPHVGVIRYVTGNLNDEASIRRALAGIDIVISTANGVTPQNKGDNARSVNDWAVRMIGLCEEAGVRRFVQSSVPPFKGEQTVPELRGKRLIEARLNQSTMQSIVVRNPAFMDVFLVMGGFGQAADHSAHATTKRAFGLGRFWGNLTGNLVERWGIFLAPGGADHGTPTIATRDVAEMLVGVALYEGDDSMLIEAGGPQWLTWREITQIMAEKVGRKRVRVLPMPAWSARLNQRLARPFSEAVANTFGLMAFVASHQPRWNSTTVVERFGLPKQLTVRDYLDLNYQPTDAAAPRVASRTNRLENRFPPPFVMIAIALAMAAIARFGSTLSWAGPRSHIISVAVVVAGLVTLVWAFLTFRRAGTTIDPVKLDRASTLVTHGIFRLSRNPMYVGFTLMLLSWSIYLASPWGFAGPVVFAAMMTRLQIIPEERMMAEKFGTLYTEYQGRVRRWI